MIDMLLKYDDVDEKFDNFCESLNDTGQQHIVDKYMRPG